MSMLKRKHQTLFYHLRSMFWFCKSKGFTNQNAINADIEIDLSRLELITRELGELRPYVDKRVKTTW